MKSCASLVVLFALSHQAVASQPDVAQSFRTAAREIPARLAAQGKDDFGRLQVANLLTTIASTPVSAEKWLSYPVEGGGSLDLTRNTAEWHHVGAAAFIHVNQTLWSKANADVRDMLALHENLGVAGFEDSNYEISSRLWLLSLPASSTNFGDTGVKEIGDAVRTLAAGGITAVGGGGDLAGLTTKISMMKRDLHRLALAAPEARIAALEEDLKIMDEVSREANGEQTGEVRIAPAAIARSARALNSCQQFLAATPDSQRYIYDHIDDADVYRKIPTFQSMIDWCRAVIRGDAG